MPKGLFNKRTMHWMPFPGGQFYPFQLRANKAEVLHRIGKWSELTLMLQQDLAKAQEMEVASQQGWCLLKLGIIDAQRGDFTKAKKKASEALQLYDMIGDGPGMFQCRAALAKIALNLKEYKRTEEITAGLLSEARQNEDLSGESEMLNNLGLICMNTGKSQQAMEYFNQKLELSRAVGDNSNSALAMGNIGCVHFDNKRWLEAIDCFNESIKLIRRTGDIYTEYFALYNLASACEKLGQIEQARTHYQRDLEMARQLGDGPGEATILCDIKRLMDQTTNDGNPAIGCGDPAQ